MDRGQRLDPVRAAHGLRSWLRQPEVQHFALCDQVFDGARHLFDRHRRVNPVLIEQIDVVGAQPLQHRVDGAADVLGLAVCAGPALTGVGVDVHPELGGDHNLIAHRLQGLPDDPFGFQRSVSLGGVEECHALVDGGADQRDHVLPTGYRAVERAGHCLAAQPDGGNLQWPQAAGTGDRGSCRDRAGVLGPA